MTEYKTLFTGQIAHLSVLTGFRMLPRKDLVRAKQYFIIDAACAAIAYALHQVQDITKWHFVSIIFKMVFRRLIFTLS